MTSNAVTDKPKLRVRLHLTHTYNGHIYATPRAVFQIWPWTHIKVGIEQQPAYQVIRLHR